MDTSICIEQIATCSVSVHCTGYVCCLVVFPKRLLLHVVKVLER